MDREAIGPYRIIGLLGKGGMGMVFEAVHQTIGRRAAIKILNAELARNAEYAQRFLNEACAVNSIGHPGIVDIYDLGTLPDGTTYLVMEFIEGETLTSRLSRSGGVMSPEEVAWIGREIAVAVAAAHKKGIIHRDLKPDNIMLAVEPESPRGERVKLLDFGIAKVTVSNGRALAETQVGTVMGTLWYMSPEQLKNTALVDERADVYSLGALLYHLLAGRPPFQARNEVELIAYHLTELPAPLQQNAPQVPEHMALLIDRMLVKDPQLRPSMSEVIRTLGGTGTTGPAIGAPKRPPETLVRPPSAVALRSGAAKLEEPEELEELEELAPDSAELNQVQAPPSVLKAPPSASTMSAAASEAHRPPQTSSRWLRVLPMAALPILALIVWVVAVRPKKPAPPLAAAPPIRTEVSPPPPAVPPTAPPAQVSTPTPPAPTVEPAVKADGQKTAPGDSGTSAPTGSLPETGSAPETGTDATGPAHGKGGGTPHSSSPAGAAGSSCQRMALSRCAVETKTSLTAEQKSALTASARTIEKKVCSGQRVRLVREGTRMVFEPRGIVSSSEADVFSGTMRGLLSKSRQGLPAEVRLKCSN